MILPPFLIRPVVAMIALTRSNQVALGGIVMTRRQWAAIGLYVTLILLCAGLLLTADFVGPVVRESLLPVAAEGFRTSLAAFVGALSVLVGANR